MSPSPRISCLTPAGTGAIATLALRGPGAWLLLRELLQPASNRPLTDSCPEAGIVIFGRLGQELADEVIVAVAQATSEPWLEIHCHGGLQVVNWLIELFVARGAVWCEWPELLRITEKRLESLASEYLVRAATLRTAAILLDQHQGAMRRALEQIRQYLQAEDTSAAAQAIRSILKFADLRRHLVASWKVVVAGPPNAGKSSLVNALAGFRRSIVTPMPGTTRDAVSTFLAVDGWPIELIDTAGIHGGATGLEREGIGLAREQIATCDLCLWLMDVTALPILPDAALSAIGVPCLTVANKIDQPAAWPVEDLCAVSALKSQGLTGLCQRLAQQLVPEAPAPGAAVPFCLELSDALEAMNR
ncbi:MAG TPA: GTPase, partial [Gemmataceae bacterium]|nr:GTPase [Gemmataceae bacterium]